MVEAALDAAALHGMVRAHSESRPAAAQMLNRVHETVWGSSAGGSFASLFYASIATETGAVFCSTAGSIEGLVIGSAGLRRMKFRQPHLGSRLDEVYRYRQFCLLEGESLIVCTGLDLGIEDGAERTRRRRKTARVLRECRGGTAQDQVCAMRGLLAADLDKRPGISRTVLVVRRVGT
jgi:serine phosphatase RsbU (regulator of sigma subunit)